MKLNEIISFVSHKKNFKKKSVYCDKFLAMNFVIINVLKTGLIL